MRRSTNFFLFSIGTAELEIRSCTTGKRCSLRLEVYRYSSPREPVVNQYSGARKLSNNTLYLLKNEINLAFYFMVKTFHFLSFISVQNIMRNFYRTNTDNTKHVRAQNATKSGTTRAARRCPRLWFCSRYLHFYIDIYSTWYNDRKIVQSSKSADTFKLRDKPIF